jgi:Polyketide cyclase / dehydrase and lipid transport
MIESIGTIVINTSPDEVFRFLAHREHFTQWATAGTGVRVVILSEGSFGDGTLIQHTQVVSRVSHMQVNQGFETDTIRIHFPSRLLVKHMHDLFQFEPVGQGTQVTLKEQIEPTPLLKPFEHLVAKRTYQHTQALLEHLKTLLEHKQG